MSVEEQNGWQHIGEHVIRLEPPNVVFLRFRGDLSGLELSRLLDRVEQFTEDQPEVFGLADLSRLGMLSPEVRRIAATRRYGAQNRGAAIFGASFRQRVIATLVMRAAELFQGRAPPIAFFDDEAQARAWIADRTRSPQRRARGPERR